MLQITCILVLFVLLLFPVGKYVYHIAACRHTFADPVFDRVDRVIYRAAGIDPKRSMGWKHYAVAMLLTNAFMLFIGYLILRVQFLPVFNPERTGSMPADLAFNTVISFMTNTDLQHYAGVSGLSDGSLMLVVIAMMFMSAASGYSVCMAMVRALASAVTGRKETGNYFADLVRITTRFFLPLALILGIVLIAQGVPQTLQGTVTVTTLENSYQDIVQGPVAALESIKHLGTNGGGFLSAGSATPVENPTVLTDLCELLAMMVMPGALTVAFGCMVKDSRQGRVLFDAMAVLLVAGLLVCLLSENASDPVMSALGLNRPAGNYEGKEVRFGIDQSALFTVVTTAFTTGSVNNMHESLTPLGSLVPLLQMMLNCVFGGTGTGLMHLLTYVVFTVFICGLMVGRTPAFLGKKIEGQTIKLATLVLIIHPLLILGFSALAVSCKAGLAGINSQDYHGLTQLLHEYTSAAANNGSGFEGLSDNSVFYNVTTGLAMFFGRYLTIVLQLAFAGSLMNSPSVSDGSGALKTNTILFMCLLVIVVCIIGALTFFPVLSLGPVAEHLTLGA